MSVRVTLATVRRVLRQLGHDHRTLALMLLFPSVLMVILRYVLNSPEMFNRVAPALLGIFPFTVMFLVTSVATLRERRSGTLERLMTLPLGRGDFLLGYALAFGVVALLQVGVVSAVTIWWLGLDVIGPVWALLLVALLDAVLGTALGLGVSAFARSEFQAVQFLPVVVLPQILLCGLFVAREQMVGFFDVLAGALPLTYAVDAMSRLASTPGTGAGLWTDVAVVAGWSVAALTLGALTLPRQTR